MDAVLPFDEARAEEHRAKQSQANQRKLRTEKLQRHLEYEQYIRNSDDWWEIRTKVMRRDNGLCQACLDADATQVHHKTYEHLYGELMWELEAVCADCHRRIHGLIDTEQESALLRAEEPPVDEVLF